MLMNHIFWARMHGGVAHFPIALLLVSVVSDLAGFWWSTEIQRREFYSVGFYSLMIAAASAPFAVLSGLALSKGVVLGNGLLVRHHYFIWPAFGLLAGLAVWRLVVRGQSSRRAFIGFLVLANADAAAMIGAGFWGGEMLVGN